MLHMQEQCGSHAMLCVPGLNTCRLDRSWRAGGEDRVQTQHLGNGDISLSFHKILVWSRAKLFYFLLRLNSQWFCNLFTFWKNFFFVSAVFKVLLLKDKRKKEKEVWCGVFCLFCFCLFIKGTGISVQNWVVTKNLNKAILCFHYIYIFWKQAF